MKKSITLLLLILFLSIVAFIDFFHNEKALQVNENCPACHFHNSIPNQSHHDVCATLQPPRLLTEEALFAGDMLHYFQVYLDHPSSRAPPRV